MNVPGQARCFYRETRQVIHLRWFIECSRMVSVEFRAMWLENKRLLAGEEDG